LSRADTRPLQAKQCEAGLTTDIPRGMRAMHTLRKLPQMAPKPAAARVAARRKPGELSVGSASTQPRYHSSAGTAWSAKTNSPPRRKTTPPERSRARTVPLDLSSTFASALPSFDGAGLEITYVIRVLVDRKFRSDAAIERPVGIV